MAWIRMLGGNKASKRYLYKDGDENVALTGGWTTSGYTFNLLANDGHIVVAANTINASPATNSSYFTILGTVNPIDLAGKSSIKVHFNNRTGTNGQGLRLVYGNSKTVSNVVVGVHSGTATDYTITFDISALTGTPVYLGLGNANAQGYYTSGTIDYIEMV